MAAMADLQALACGLDRPEPWLAPYRSAAQPVMPAVLQGSDVADALNRALAQRPITHPAGRLQFVPQDELPEGQAYEAYIARTARVPTRNNLHDLLNGLVWLVQPALKCRLNALQAREIARDGVQGRRGPLRDALTVFDENGALLRGPTELTAALAARDWRRLFIDLRAQWAQAELTVVGHALLEKLVHPYKAITAHVLVLPAAAGIDDILQPEHLGGKPFLPLPVLGVPQWWPANAQPAFYDDPQVFRPRRERETARPVIIAM